MSYEEDAAPVTVLTTVRVSRKARTCSVCLGEIKPGERYARRFLPPDAEHEKAMTVAEHENAGACWFFLGGTAP